MPPEASMPLAERICFWTYVALGPLAWILCAYFLAIGRERMNKLLRSKAKLPPDPPLVSVLIPAKDEGQRIAACVQRVLEQDYPAIEVIAVNDRSGDDTGAILDRFANQNASKNVHVIHIDSLPAGWLGKCHALDAGAKHATGEWLLFVDSDVVLEPDALSKLAALSIDRQYDALSILTTVETQNLAEKMMLPLLAATWSSTFAADQTNEDSETDTALANGQVFLIRKSAYDAVGGHASVKDRIVEDVELARLLKKQGFKMRFLSGAHLARTRMHTTLPHMFNAWARIFAGTARGSIWPMLRTIAFILLCACSIFPALFASYHFGLTRTVWTYYPDEALGHVYWSSGIYWAAAAAIHGLLMIGVNGLIWRWSGNNPLYALLLPISVFIELAILIFSIRKAFSGTIKWRGMSIDLRQTSRVVEK